MGSKATVLIVDDEEVIRESMRALFGHRGVVVDTAETRDEAAGLISSKRYGAYILDLGTSQPRKVYGPSLGNAKRDLAGIARRRANDAFIVGFSGQGHGGLDAAYDNFYLKPTELTQLIDATMAHLKKRSTQLK